MHRRHHARRVPQVHRARRGPRAALPAGHGRGADARADDRDPDGHPRALRAAPQGHDHGRGRQGRGRPVDPLHHRPPPAGQGDRPHRRGRQPRPPAPRLRAARPARGPEGARARSPRRRTPRSTRQEYEEAATLRESEATARAEASTTCAPSGRPRSPTSSPRSDEEEIAQVVAMWTGIPVTRIAQEESERLLHMEDALHKRVIGQEEAIETVSQGRPPRPRRPQGPQAADRLVHLPRPHRRRQDRAGQGAGRVHVRLARTRSSRST